eukprot:CAMPEP_0194133020 /NCGR_PEP_ID=MMETSP0152-20130528/3342_1 /TAXON_ID=1049557 /ORGANISM="Thalassiothrix antarctica, Strain L6-D1" /LENGTH=498 /DNA_ID=CAMNT_0038828247 /DNA_START=101 /DNA_END=1597 /DNA_ORIENTATION=-
MKSDNNTEKKNDYSFVAGDRAIFIRCLLFFILLISFCTIFMDQNNLILIQTSRVTTVNNNINIRWQGEENDDASHGQQEDNVSIQQQGRRTKLHVCWNRKRSRHAYQILTEEFAFDEVDATKGESWDLIFGGYPWCGNGSNGVVADEEKDNGQHQPDDYLMQTGLNKHLLKQGFHNLEPHQVYFPCMGCPSTFCNKERLCYLQRKIDPESCYLLPQDYDKIVQKMNSTKKKSFVLKHDSSTSAVHSGQGVKMIDSIDQLPSKEELLTQNYLVQPFQRSYLGKGSYRRTTEVRYYVTITSVTPLRVYYFNQQWMPMSSTMWLDDPPSELYKRCMQDSHVYKAECKSVATRHMEDGESRRMRFTEYQNQTGMSDKIARRFHHQATRTMARIFEASLPVLQNNTINRGITSAGASCFSFMRADFGISQKGNAFLYEINEFPYGTEPKTAGEVQQQAYRELFAMIGLDVAPLSVEDRADYEAEHAGNWTRLIDEEDDESEEE